MIDTKTIVAALNAELAIDTFNDYCPNGLQIEGVDQVAKVVTAVTASLNAIHYAKEVGAQLLLVHHGYFWKGEASALVGMKYRRVKALLDSDINLVAYHLPLDAHQRLGNNAQLAARLGINTLGLLSEKDSTLGFRGELSEPISGIAFQQKIAAALGRQVTHVGVDKPIKTVGWCTGAGQGFIDMAADMGLDAFVSGEISEPTAHIARERDIHYFAAGHHATERYGVQALGQWLVENYQLEHEFFDDANPA